MKILSKIFGDANEKYLKKFQPIVEKINSLEREFKDRALNDLSARTLEFKERLNKGENLDDILPEVFALVRESAKRTLKQRHFDVQLIGGIALHQGEIAEMKTGEGKTLAATLPVYLNALEQKGVHVITVNDYLARRDTVWMGQIYHLLSLSIGCLNHDQAFLYDPDYKKPQEQEEKIRDELGGFKVVEDFLRPCSRKEAYSADITYGTNNEFGFDYLRDNMVYDLKNQAQRGLNYAIIDEVDSILIDEARTPLIISAPDKESSKMYGEFSQITPLLKGNDDYNIDEKIRAVILTEEGIDKIEKILGLENIYQEKGMRYLHHLEQALRADFLFKRDKDYVVKNNQVIIVDEFTGRLMPGRRWSGGLHQAVEAKEGVQVQPESITLASITFQNYFRLYKKLAGMTGTAVTSAEEFDKVFGLEVVIVPTDQPMIRTDLSDRIYKTEEGKFKSIIKEIKTKNQKGQPVLVGTRSVERNEYLGKLLEKEGVPHQILNAKHHQKEGEIIAQAGKVAAITIATNMAGRGVDIVLGGNPSSPEEAQKVKELGGLHIIGTERHEARRTDNQLRGRSGRQGDPGSSQFFVSLEDELLRIFGSEKIKSLMGILKIPDDQPIEANLVSSAIEQAQSKIEGFNFDARKHLLEYDDVMNKHRETIYKKRREILQASPQELKEKILSQFLKGGHSKEDYEKKEKETGDEKMRQIEKILSLRTLDMLWMNHLEEMDYLRDSVGLRAYGQRDPLIEYKNEGHRTFQRLLSEIDSSIANTILKVNLVREPVSIPQSTDYNLNREKASAGSRSTTANKKKIGRNDPCPCGAKKPDGRSVKYKHCHGK